MNNVNLMGRLCADPELKTTQGGLAVCRVSLAVDRIKKTERVTDFISLTLWEKSAENLAKYCRKGDQIGVTGVLIPSTYENSKGDRVRDYSVHVNAWDFGAKAAREEKAPEPEEGLPF